MNKSIQLLAAAFGLLVAGTQAATVYALSDSQCEVAIPLNGDLADRICQPANQNKQAIITLNDLINDGARYDYKIKVTKGTNPADTVGLGVLLDANSNRTASAAGGSCPQCDDGRGIDANFGTIKGCVLASAHTAAKVRVGINN